VKILAFGANSSRTLGHRKYLYKYQLQAYYGAIFTQNFKLLNIKMRELELEPQCAGAVWHIKAKLVQIVPGVTSQEPLAMENTCKNINCRYIIEPASH